MTKEFLEEKLKEKCTKELNQEIQLIREEFIKKFTTALFGYSTGYSELGDVIKNAFNSHKEKAIERRVKLSIETILMRLEEIRPLFFDIQQ